MTDETPQERLRRILQEARDKGRPPSQSTPEDDSDEDQAGASDDLPPEVRGILESILGHVAGKAGKIHIGEVRMDKDGNFEVKEIKEVKNPTTPPLAPFTPTPDKVGVPMNLDALGHIEDTRTQETARQYLTQLTETSSAVSSQSAEHPLVQFSLTIGTVIGQAAMAHAMVEAGAKGQPQFTSQDLVLSISSTVGMAVLSAIRFGQNNPDALMGEGVDLASFEAGLEELLSSQGPTEGSAQQPKEEHE
jgi:hypothetical protein